jgi:type IV secretory pathway VirB2 component (pilin)
MDVDKPRADLSAYPWATLLVVFFAIVGGLVTIFNESSLGFDEYLTLVLGAAAALSLGRGLAYKEDALVENPLSRFLNSIPWATLLVVVFALVGGVVLLIGESSLNFEEYITRVLAAGAVLGIGRGIATFKQDHAYINTDPDSPEVTAALAEGEPPSEEELREVFPDDPPTEPEGAVGGKPGETVDTPEEG